MKINTLCIALALLSFTACKSMKGQSENSGKPEAQTSTAPNHNSQNALDWASLYQGIIPCADCEGIKTEIKLNEDLSYTKAIQYLGKSEELIQSTGTFAWDNSGSNITLTEAGSKPYKFKVGENILIALDADGNRLTGDRSTQYNLKKATMDTDITEKYWKLIELNGQAITTGEKQKEIHLILKNEDNLVAGFGGCNLLNGIYELDEKTNRLSFSKMKTTLMACENMQTEDMFHKVLAKIDNYTIKNDTLSLNKARMAPLAKFTVVYLR